MEDANTQAAEGQTEQSVANPNSNADGVQKRIDELTAEKYALKAQMDAQALALQQQQQMVAQLMDKINQPAPIAPIEIDPDRRSELDAYLKPMIQQLQSQVQQIRQAQAVNDVQQMAQRFNVSPEIAQRAITIAQSQNTSVDVALRYAIGEAYTNGKLPPPAQQNRNRQQMNNGVNGVLSGGSVTGNMMPNQGPSPYPANWRELHPAQQLEWFAKNRPDLDNESF